VIISPWYLDLCLSLGCGAGILIEESCKQVVCHNCRVSDTILVELSPPWSLDLCPSLGCGVGILFEVSCKQLVCHNCWVYNGNNPTISLEMPVPSQGHYGFQFSGC
jgi:hypothetical protein